MVFTELIYTVYGTIILLVRQGICDSVVFFTMMVDGSNSLHSLPRGGLP